MNGSYKKIILGICVSIIFISITYAFKPLPIALLINGYNPLNYKVYKQIDDSGDLIIRAQYFDDDFNYIIARKKNNFGWNISYDGVKSSINIISGDVQYLIKYTSLIWSNHILVVSDYNDSEIEVNHHRIIEIDKINQKIHFDFTKLPNDIEYILKETPTSYIIELSNRASKDSGSISVGMIDIKDFIANVYQ